MARKSADLGHHLHQGLHILHYSSLKLYTQNHINHSGRDRNTNTFSPVYLVSDESFIMPRTHCYCGTHQAFNHLQQFLHHHSDALVAQKSAHDLDVRRTHEVPVRAKYAAVRQVQGLQPEEQRAALFNQTILSVRTKWALKVKSAPEGALVTVLTVCYMGQFIHLSGIIEIICVQNETDLRVVLEKSYWRLKRALHLFYT